MTILAHSRPRPRQRLPHQGPAKAPAAPSGVDRDGAEEDRPGLLVPLEEEGAAGLAGGRDEEDEALVQDLGPREKLLPIRPGAGQGAEHLDKIPVSHGREGLEGAEEVGIALQDEARLLKMVARDPEPGGQEQVELGDALLRGLKGTGKEEAIASPSSVEGVEEGKAPPAAREEAPRRSRETAPRGFAPPSASTGRKLG